MSSKVLDNSKSHCNVCNVNFNTAAEYAIHEFSKRHCDNLLRLSKNKPLKTKTLKPVAATADNENLIPSTLPKENGQFSLYGYFTPEETLAGSLGCPPKEYDYNYDPYLQKFADGPEKKVTVVQPAPQVYNVTRFGKTKKKKVRTCQICNITLHTIPEYEAHMKSPQHVWKLKLTGMGVSAHFVKASNDLHTIENSEDSPASTDTIDSSTLMAVPIAPSELFCEICEILLNSQMQYQAHMSGKSHSDKVKLKEVAMAKKLQNESPSPGQLYCFSCKLSLNNIVQYNDHKNGKKHKTKCRNLVREGITIPPEERTIDMVRATPDPSRPAVYPENYKFVIKSSEKNVNATETIECKEKNSQTNDAHVSGNPADAAEIKEWNGDRKNEPLISTLSNFKCSPCKACYEEQQPFETHLNSEEHALKLVEICKSEQTTAEVLAKVLSDRRVILPNRYGQYLCGVCAVLSGNELENEQHLNSELHKHGEREYEKKRSLELKWLPSVGEDGSFSCRLCSESWISLTEYNVHLHNPKHKNLSWQEYNKRNSPKRGFPLGSKKKEEKNPGVRTKVSGLATDLSSGTVEPVPNLEQLEPKIEPTKNVTIGLSCDDNSKRKRLSEDAARFQGGPRGWRGPPPRFHPYHIQFPPTRPPFPSPRWRAPPPWY